MNKETYEKYFPDKKQFIISAIILSLGVSFIYANNSGSNFRIDGLIYCLFFSWIGLFSLATAMVNFLRK